MEPKLLVARAVTKLLLQYPFYGSLALALRMMQDDTIDTMCTDGKSIKWSANFVATLDPLQVMFVITHEVLHVAFKHMFRIGKRNHKLWNIACDFAINAILIKMFGIEAMPEGGLYDPQYEGMSAEKIYDLIKDMSDDEVDEITGGRDQWQMGDFQEPKDGNGDAMQEAELDQLSDDIDQKVIIAADTARAVGKLPSEVQELVDIMKRSQVDLETVVSRFVGGDVPADFSYRKINRRSYMMLDMVSPTIAKHSVGHVIIKIDSSASVRKEELQYFLGICNQFVEEKQPESVTIITWDTKVRTVTTYDKGQAIPDLKLTGRGGTLISPVFQYVEDNQLPCDYSIVLSDMCIFDYPERPADYPVLWVSPDMRSKPAPWGKSTWMKAA